MDGLLIGRFQPFHLGHLAAIKFALSKVDNIWLGIGSSNRPREKNNPFTAQEREQMIFSSLDSKTSERIQIYHIPDLDDHKKWLKSLDDIVPPYQAVFSNDEMTQNMYLKRNMEVISIPFEKRDDYSGTNIRTKILDDQDWEHLVPEGTKKTLQEIGAKARLEHL